MFWHGMMNSFPQKVTEQWKDYNEISWFENILRKKAHKILITYYILIKENSLFNLIIEIYQPYTIGKSAMSVEFYL